MRPFEVGEIVGKSYHLAATLLIISGLLTISASAESETATELGQADVIRRAVDEGKLSFRLATPEDLKVLIGPAVKETTENDGGMEILVLDYAAARAIFGRMRGFSAPFALYEVTVGGKAIDIGQNRQIVLRKEDDLKKFDRFWGFANVSLVNIDLRRHLRLLQTMPFDSRTLWPEPDRLPEGFDPVRVLENGKNPGLGVRRLHKQGINGDGVGIAVIDQPLVKNHKEYVHSIARYEEIDVDRVEPQMHGPAVASIAVGKHCGVAPAAKLHYYAIPMWKWNKCQPYCQVVAQIIESNSRLKPSDRIRVVSISTGMFSHWNDFALWRETLRKAQEHGILVVTCDMAAASYGTLNRIAGKDPEDPNSYSAGRHGAGLSTFLVPAGNRTTASHEGPEVYTYWTEAGMSWATPYVAGLAALAYQVNPKIEPKEIAELWSKTAVQTDTGPIVNPAFFIECVQDPAKVSKLSARAARPNRQKSTVLSDAQRSMMEKVAQLSINDATRQDVVRIFGKPVSYQRDGQTLAENDLPEGYTMAYADGFSVSIYKGRIEELRFQKPGYVFRGGITVGSTLEEVLEVLGSQTRTVDATEYRLERGVLYAPQGDRIELEDGVIYKNIGHRTGFCYYDARTSRGLRMLLMNNRVVALCVTGKNPR